MEDADAGILLAEYEKTRAIAEATRQNLEILAASIMELEGVRDALEELKGAEAGSEVYVPLGGDSFVKARLEETDMVIQGIGADVAVKRKVGEALEFLQERIERLEGMKEEQNKKMTSAIARLEELAPAIQQLASQVKEQGR
ncbi:MAG: prefoldin subunit alpha [Euryarchaeota archaeon]|nr:prefoldin subunit alpha [Euryarchaeota archaeon]